MGGAVSSGRDNNELIDNLMGGNYIRSPHVERVFRGLDRAEYMTPEARDQAYKDLAWRNGPLHLSSPCIYSEVMEGLDLSPGLSFLNIGSGTGYLSTMVGLILGTSGISHGVEVHPAVVEYAVKKMGQFIENSALLDDFDFCQPKFYNGNGLCLAPLLSGYDRVYVGAGCPTEYQNYFKRLIKVGGILVMPLNDALLQVRRTSDAKWTSRNLLNVTFATLRLPTREEAAMPVKLEEQTPVRLQYLARAVVRSAMHKGIHRRHPELREAPRAPRQATCPRRICIPIEPGGAVEGLNVLHDLDTENGANEMNALLSLVISMGHNRVGGALRFDRVDSASDSSDEDDEEQADQPEATGDAGNQNNNQPPTDQRPGDQPDNHSDTSQQDSDSDEPKPPRPRVKRSGPKSSDKRSGPKSSDKPRRQRRPRSDGEDSKSRVRTVISYNLTDIPSTSSKEAQTSSGDFTDSSDLKSSESADDSAQCSKDVNKRRTLPGVPSEVEIDLGAKVAQEASTSHADMDWEETKTDTLEASDDDTDTKSKAKRQKLDSGIGENTPSSSSPDKTKSETDTEHSDSPTDEGSHNDGYGSSDSSMMRRHAEMRRRRIARGGDARRVRLSLLMKQAVRELPLPHALKKFVNLGRCFEF